MTGMDWDEIRTAYAVARLGTVSAAAEHLGVHRATVVRHVDGLEETLGAKLFQRHARGYAPTEVGDDLLRLAQTMEEQFTAFAGRTRGRSMSVTGELVVTSVEIIAPIVVPALRDFQQAHPETRISYVASPRIHRLEYGEAHVAIRAGDKPQLADNIVQPFVVMQSALYAHARYVARRGRPQSPDEYRAHAFLRNTRSPIANWGKQWFPDSSVVFSSSNEGLLFQALDAGMGIAFCPTLLARQDPELVQIHPPEPEWDVSFWLMTHVDLHWSPKVQAILKHLRAVGAGQVPRKSKASDPG